MFSWWITKIFRMNSSTFVTKNGMWGRFALAIGLLIAYILLFVVVQRLRKKELVRKRTAVIFSSILIFETIVLLPFLQGPRHVQLEYVCNVETAYNDHHDAAHPLWETNCSIDSAYVSKESLEEYLDCSLAEIDFDDNYTYLFVYYYKDVDLVYSNWTKTAGNTILSTDNSWLGKLSVQGEDTDNTIFIFRFPRKKIIHHEC